MSHDLLNISLNQGKQFNSYQSNIKKKNKSLRKEGFQNSITNTNTNTNTEETNANTDELTQMQTNYNDLMKKYKSIETKVNVSSLISINRDSSKNPYLNKIIRFTTGELCYVTNRGFAKHISSDEIANSLNIPKEYVDIDLPWNSSYLIEGTMIPTIPPLIVGSPMKMGQSVGYEGSNVYVNSLLPKDTTPSYVGCYASGSNVTFIGNKPNEEELNGEYTYEQCKNSAIENGYQYFALQNVNSSSSKGYCAVSKDEQSFTKYGEGMIASKQVILWSSNTGGQPGNIATLTNTGSLTITNTEGRVIFSTPIKEPEKAGYIGCYADKSSRAMPNTSNGAYYNIDKCKQLAQEGGYKYYAGQNGNKDSAGNWNVWCAASNDLTSAKKYGVASNCIDADGIMLGGGWSNAIYALTAEGPYYLILQDDGNMNIFRGNNPDDNQGDIWSSNTTGKQEGANPKMTASKGKYGKNWMSTDSTLGANDFISSTNGDLTLTMQSDGNLVLCTYQMETNCHPLGDKMGGGIGANAVYNIHKTSDPKNMGLIGYVNADSILMQYPDSMVGFTNDYQIFQNTDSIGNDISTLTTSDQTGCQTECDNNAECAAYVYQGSSQTCWLKNRSATKKEMNSNTVLGIRKPKLAGSSSCSNQIVDVDSIQYNNYVRGNEMTPETQCSKPTVSKEYLNEFDNIKSQLNTLGNDIVSKMESAYKQDTETYNTMNKSSEQFKKDLEEYKKINSQKSIEGMKTMEDLNGMLTDSDLLVLQGNYSYIMWSILAVGILTVTINTMK
jgi:hypothetical protein